MARKKSQGTKLAVFKGREAKLNRAIFQILAAKGPQTIYDIHGQIQRCRGLKRTHYGNLNKRVRALNQSGYLKPIGFHSTKAGFEATLYELTVKTYIALVLDSISLEDMLNRMDEESGYQFLFVLAGLI